MIRISCDQTGEDLTGKRHISITRQSLRTQDGTGLWKPVSPVSKSGVLYFKDWEALAEWGREHENREEDSEWNAAPSRDARVVY